MSRLILSSLIAIPLGIIVGLIVDASSSISKLIIRGATWRMPSWQKELYQSDWLANLETFETKAQKLYWSICCCKASLCIFPPGYLACLSLQVFVCRAIFRCNAFVVDRIGEDYWQPERPFSAKMMLWSVGATANTAGWYLEARAKLIRARSGELSVLHLVHLLADMSDREMLVMHILSKKSGMVSEVRDALGWGPVD